MKRLLTPVVVLVAAWVGQEQVIDLSPTSWLADYDEFIQAQLVDRTEAGVASGKNGAVTVAYNGLAARAGLEALMQGGNAIDAAITTAVALCRIEVGRSILRAGGFEQ